MEVFYLNIDLLLGIRYFINEIKFPNSEIYGATYMLMIASYH